MSHPDRCPKCDADLDGGEIPEDIRHNYSPPYRWGRVISIYDQGADRHDHWKCPDCAHEWR